MKREMLAMFGGGALLAAAAVPALAGMGTAYELEHARATVRAGGPISDYDAELLERWGNSTGGPDWRKMYREERGYDDAPVRTERRKHKRQIRRD